MQRILIVKTTSMGDVIHALPVAHDIKRAFSHVHINWMVEAPFADLVQACPNVDAVLPVAVRVWRKGGVRKLWHEWCQLKARLSPVAYDAVLDLQGLVKSAALQSAARGPRMGPGFGFAREPIAALFYRHRGGWDASAHTVERLRQLSAGLLGYSVHGPAVFYNHRALPKPIVPRQATVWFIHATARAEKQWPIAHWRELAHRLSDMGYRIQLPSGNAREAAEAQLIAQNIAHVEVLPHMSLFDISQELQQVHMVVGVDTGLMHLAAAHYLPMVAIFVATPSWRFGPSFNPYAHSLGDVGQLPSAAQVFESVMRLVRNHAA